MAAALALAAAAPAAAQVCPYQDLMPEFAELVAATADFVPQARAAAFVERFAAKHPDFYSEQVFGSRETLLEGAERLFDPQRAPRLESSRRITLDDVLGTGRSVTADYARMEATFRAAFPDYRCETPISFGISLYMFDGNQWALWNEGLASYVSWQLNPTLTAPEIFWNAQLQPKLADAARLLLADLDGHEAYGRWFLGGENPPGLPSRSGYYLGYLLAKQLDRDDLAALARIPPQRIAVEARKFLESLADK